ncbi:hypothetical protein HDU83_006077 [Entophlyctis luteolus]|nr:hypothetical protein HDU83_006077 [Entophlyctis luteolus]
MSKSRKQFTHRRTIKLTVSWCIYSPPHSLLAIYSGSTSEVSLLHLATRRGGVVEFPPINVDSGPSIGDSLGFGFSTAISRLWGTGNSTETVKISKRDFQLAQIYDSLCCLYVFSPDAKNGQRAIPQLFVYRITPSAVSFLCFLNLQKPGNYIVSVIDNLILVHNTIAEGYLVFDVKQSMPGLLDTDRLHFDSKDIPIMEPLLICAEGGVFKSLYAHSDTQFIFPHYIISSARTARVSAFEITQELAGAVTLLEQQGKPAPEIVKFLLRRNVTERESQAVNLTMEVLRKEVEDFCRGNVARRTSVEKIREAFNVVADFDIFVGREVDTLGNVGWISTRSIDNQPMNIVLGVWFTVSELMNRVFKPLAYEYADESHLRRLVECLGVFSASRVSQYESKNSRQDGRSAWPEKEKQEIELLIVSTHLRLDQSEIVCQLISANAISDSELVANQLLSETIGWLEGKAGSATFSATAKLLHGNVKLMNDFHAGIEMLKRLRMTEEVVIAFLKAGKVLDALEAAIDFGTLDSFAPSEFLEPALGMRDKTLFLNVFREFDERGLISHEDDGSEYHPHGWARYASAFRELWGEALDMEGMQ